MMKTNKITIAKSDNGGFNMMTTSTNTPISYAELDSLMYEIASVMAECDRDANNECEENLQLAESDEHLIAIKRNALSHAQAKVMHLAKVLLETDEPFTEGMQNFFRTLATTAFFHGWDSCCDNYRLEQGGDE